MTKEQEKFMIKNQKLDELCKETQEYGRMQFVDRIADLELDKDNLIKYLERKIKIEKDVKEFTDKVLQESSAYESGLINAYQDILEKVKSGKYE